MVSVLITTYNSARFLKTCLESLLQQVYKPLEVIVVDNASSDGTRDVLANAGPGLTVMYNDSNIGFAAAQNQAARLAKGNWLLSLNPDVVVSRDFVAKAVECGNLDPKTGAVCGKLLRWNPSENPEFTQIIDSTGIYFLPNLRHLDRGAGEPDHGQFEQMEYVFGATGAAALYRRSMVDDVSVNGCGLSLAGPVNGLAVRVYPCGSGMACEASHPGASRRASDRNQLALHQESLFDACQEHFASALRQVFPTGYSPRSAGNWILSACGPQTGFCVDRSVEISA
jgi:glycosyltransferase involved in cell wall biosynthesis